MFYLFVIYSYLNCKMWLVVTKSDSRSIDREKKTTGWSTEELSVEKKQLIEEPYPTTNLSSMSMSFFAVVYF